MLILDPDRNILSDTARGLIFDPAERRWANAGCELTGRSQSLRDAASWLQRASGYPIRTPVAVVGPRQATSDEVATAEALGAGLAAIGFFVVCGGRQGVMEAVCRGVAAKEGLAIGLLPGTEPDDANPHVTVRIATGIGEARNAIIARAGFCLVAVGSSYGTLSEVALGLQFGRPVFGLCGAAQIDGIEACNGPEAALDAVCRVALAIKT